MVEKPPPHPVWKHPAWLTAMVAVISVFLTVPDKIGDFFTKKQDIEIAKAEEQAAKLRNEQSKQDQEFLIVQNTLTQQGTERVFLLRYFAATLDDVDAQTWAKAEVKRLETLSSTQDELNKLRKELEKTQTQLSIQTTAGGDVAHLQQEVEKLEKELSDKDSQVAEMRQNAGIEVTNELQNRTYVRIDLGDVDIEKTVLVDIPEKNISFLCFKDEICDSLLLGKQPETIIVNYSSNNISVYSKYFTTEHYKGISFKLGGYFEALGSRFFKGIGFGSGGINYICSTGETNTICKLPPEYQGLQWSVNQ